MLHPEGDDITECLTPFELPSAGELQRAQQPFMDLIPKQMPLCPGSVGTGRQEADLPAELGFAGALDGF